MSDVASNALLTIRPSTSQYQKMLKTTPIFLLIFVGFMVLRNGVWGLALAVVAGGLAIGAVFLYIRRAHIVVTPNEIVHVGMIRRRSWARSEIATVVGAPLPASAMDARVFLNLFLLDRAGKKILRLKNTHWADADLTQLTDVLGLPVDNPGEVVTPKQFDARYPGVLPAIERRPWAFSFLIAGVLIVLVIVIAVAVVAAGS